MKAHRQSHTDPEVLTSDQAKEWLRYDPNSGAFYWLKTSGKGYAGNVAGTKHRKGYIAISVLGQNVLAHRLAWLMTNGEWPTKQIDHKNGDKADNRIANLRLATNAENLANRGAQRNSSSGIKGVYWFKPQQKWKAQICVQGKCIVLGYFDQKEAAAAARAEAEARYQGEFKHEGAPTLAYGP